MIPAPFTFLILALGAYRVTRLIGWDDLPPVVAVRNWVTGAEVSATGSHAAHAGLSAERPIVSVTYRRPLLAHFIDCPFCQGFWVAVAFYVAWVYEPTATKYGAGALALAAAVGLLAKNLDP